MTKEIITTSDGSHTVHIPEMKVTYHSVHGAVQESIHVFIQAGLHKVFEQFTDEVIEVFEMGFGTGLNAYLTAIEATRAKRKVHYTAVELFPLTQQQVAGLNYHQLFAEDATIFLQLHQGPWNDNIPLSDYFTVNKQQTDLKEFKTHQRFHLVYYDAFAPTAQPELWTESIFKHLHQMMVPPGVLVTYCSKGSVRRAMQAAGFTIEKIPGPPGKREMVRAFAQPKDVALF